MERIRWYLAGKIGDADDWRSEVVRGLDGANRAFRAEVEDAPYVERFPILESAVLGHEGWDYVGPYYVEAHCGWNDDYVSHAAPDGLGSHDVEDRTVIHSLCLRAIRECDIVFAWVDRADCYGTLVEVGYALSQDKRIMVCFPPSAAKIEQDMWFVASCSNERARFWQPDGYRSAYEALGFYYQAIHFEWLYSNLENRLQNRIRELEAKSLVTEEIKALPEASAVRRDPQRSFSKQQKKEIYLRANGHCQSCAQALDSDWHADHIVPWSRGGRTEVINGQSLCRDCNLRKQAKVLTVDQEA